MKDLVSIIVPAYNAEIFIEECINSIVGQTYQNIEIIVVNDGSKDTTGYICDMLAQIDDKIKVIHQDNAGVSAARNCGIKAALGEFICFVDADDTLPSDSIEILVQELKEHNADVVFGNNAYVYNGKIIERYPRIKEGTYQKKEFFSFIVDNGSLSGITFGSVCGAIYETSYLRKCNIAFRENLKVNEDGVFNVEYCLAVLNVYYTARIVYNYRQWKQTKNPDVEKMAKGLSDATEAIKHICMKSMNDNSFEKQINGRELFCVFQISVTVSAMNYRSAVKVYRDVWNNPLIRESNLLLNFDKISRVKKTLWWFIYHKKYLCFYILMHFFYPMVERLIRR